jgi:hypothetical protein
MITSRPCPGPCSFRVSAASRVLVLLALAAGCAGSPRDSGTVAPGAGPSARLRVVVVSDLNGPYGSTAYGPEVAAAVRLIREEWRPDVVLAAGDMVAGQRPTLTDENVRAMWAAFDSVVAGPLRAAGIPFGFSLGNHDASAHPAHERDRALAVAHWRVRDRHTGVAFVDSTHFPLYYSFRQGPVFVLSWDASWHGTHSDTAMIRWLRAQLAGEEARAAAFRVVLGHLPLYAVAEGRNRAGEVLAEPESLRALLEEHDVHLYISGHHHAYYPGRRGALELLHAGAVGDGPRPLLGDTVPSPRTVTVLDFDAVTGTIGYTTHAMAGDHATHVIETTSLPPYLDGINGRVFRRDVAGTPRIR